MCFLSTFSLNPLNFEPKTVLRFWSPMLRKSFLRETKVCQKLSPVNISTCFPNIIPKLRGKFQIVSSRCIWETSKRYSSCERRQATARRIDTRQQQKIQEFCNGFSAIIPLYTKQWCFPTFSALHSSSYDVNYDGFWACKEIHITLGARRRGWTTIRIPEVRNF